MARARSSANVTASVRFRIPLGAGFLEKYHVSPLSILGHYFDVVSTLPTHASLDSGVNEYLVGQRWQCVRLVPCAEMAASAVCSKRELKWYMNEQV